MSVKKAILIAPHPDDELFALSIIRNLKKKSFSVTLASFNLGPRRVSEFNLSARFLGCESIFIDGHFTDGDYHKKFLQLKQALVRLFSEKYDKIVLPLLEGGHQDHDSLSLAATLVLSDKKCSDKIIYYGTYYSACRSVFFAHRWNEPSGYTSLMSVSMVDNLLNILIIYFLVLTCYQSQYKTWILLLPSLCLGVLLNRFSGFSLRSTTSFPSSRLALDTIRTFSANHRPLYCFHNRISYSSWLKFMTQIVF